MQTWPDSFFFFFHKTEGKYCTFKILLLLTHNPLEKNYTKLYLQK